MKQPDEVKREFTHQWMTKAEADFLTAEHLCNSGEEYVYGVVFHAQQASEKYLKAFLVWHQIEFQKTHDIAVLLKLASGVDEEMVNSLSDAQELTPYGVEYRYPGEYPDASVADARRALNLAGQVRKEVRRRLLTDTLSKGA
jgi:HEPN domain-containing protein